MPQNNLIPSYEKEIYDQLADIRAELSTLKQDRSKYINSKDIYSIYEKVLFIINELTTIRKDEELKGMTLALPNRIDSILDDVFQLLSLSFMTVGLINLAPATYASLSTVQRILEHLNESEVYSLDDLKPIKLRLQEIKQIVIGDDNEGDSDHKNEEILLLRNKLQRCEQEYHSLEKHAISTSPDLKPVLNHILEVKKRLLNLLTSDLLPSDINFDELTDEINAIKAKRDEDGNFPTVERSGSSQVVLNGLLDDIDNLFNDLQYHEENSQIDESLRPIYLKLNNIKSTLENLLVTRRWTLRETDLYNYQKQLSEIDDLRKNGSFGKNIKGQLVILYLLRRCYAIIYKLLESSEPVSEALQPLHNQLSTVRRCLLEVKRMGGINSARELYPYQFKLASLDNLRVDGKFMINDQIPEGQGTLNALLAECFDICHEMKIELDEDDTSNRGNSENYTKSDEYDEEVTLDRLQIDDDGDYDSYPPSEMASEMASINDSIEGNDYY